jgi:hypothetical protein
VDVTDVFSLLLAIALVAVGGSYAAAAAATLPRRAAAFIAGLVGAAAVAAWIALVYEPSWTQAGVAAGLTAAAAAELGALAFARVVARGRRIEAASARAEAQLHELVERETAARSAEIERMLALARADSVSLLAEQERKLAEEHRRALVEQHARGHDALATALAAAQRQVDQRLAEWARDLERVQESLAAQLSKLADRERAVIAGVETRIAEDAERVAADSEEHRAALTRLREEIGKSIEDVASAAAEELEAQAGVRRRALHEVGDRLRRREQALLEQIEREEAEAAQRIQAGFADIERRQLEQIERTAKRANASALEEAALAFAETIKSAREEAARRLARELDRAVMTFEREAGHVIGERMSQMSDAGSLRIDKRFNQVTAGLERHREEAVAAFDRRLGEAETELVRRIEAIAADAEAEQAVLEARLSDLARRIDEAYARAR